MLGIPRTLSALLLVFLIGSPVLAQPDQEGDPHPSDIGRIIAPPPSGPRTSPFEPPEASDTTFVTDSGPKLDTGCLYRSSGPITIDIEIDRYVGEVDADGALVKAADLVAHKVLSPKATLTIPVFDVDSSATEVDKVYFNGEFIGTLQGQNNTWTNRSSEPLEVDIAKVRFPERGSLGEKPRPAKNEIRIDIDTANAASGQEVWCMSADWASLSFMAMSPIVLIHGNNSFPGFFEKYGFTQGLDELGLAYDASIQLRTSIIEDNGLDLSGQIPSVVESFGVDSIHVVGHSKGGLDLREYLAEYQPGYDRDFEVLSYTSLDSPHNGTLLCDVLLLRETALQNASRLRYVNFPRFSRQVAALAQRQFDIGKRSLTTYSMAGFNERNLPRLLASKTVFNTTAADADLNGNGRMDDGEYDELREENFFLYVPILGRIAVDVPFRILRNSQRITLSYEFGSSYTTAILTAISPPQPIFNDTLVPAPSAQGVGPLSSRVRNTHLFVGGEGRNHASIANAGVGRMVGGWIIDLERYLGDLR